MRSPQQYKRQYMTLVRKIRILSSLRKTVYLPEDWDITDRQWFVLESQLASEETRLLSRLKTGSRKHLGSIHEIESQRGLNELFGDMELRLSRSLIFYDTYMDLLTQRLSPELGPMLAGCDALALDALNKDHPALDIIEPPIVYCDRGFGASVLREGIPLPDGSRNPLPVIQIPYSKFREKYNLTSIMHEAGHEVIVRLELVNVLPKVVKAALQDAHAPDNISDLYALWMSESAPDFWVFCNAGVAQPLSIMEIMSLPRKYVMRISPGDPHPPPYIRVLLSFEWCQHQWGKGDWDDWETEWKRRYPIENASEGELLELATRYIPVVSKALFNTRFKILGDKSIPSLFDLDSIAPNKLERLAKMADSGIVMLTGLNPCAQLALFWVLRYKKHLGEEIIDRLMTKWLIRLGKQRK